LVPIATIWESRAGVGLAAGGAVGAGVALAAGGAVGAAFGVGSLAGSGFVIVLGIFDCSTAFTSLGSTAACPAAGGAPQAVSSANSTNSASSARQRDLQERALQAEYPLCGAVAGQGWMFISLPS
jgi:hypothetical protein